MDLGLAGRTALVTASSGGIGRQCALALAREGARVVMCARGRERLEATAAEVSGVAGSENVLAQPGDVASDADMAALVAAAIARFGGIDVLVCIGGSPKRGGWHEVEAQDLRDAFEVTVVAAFRLIRLVLPGMRERRWGRIVTVQARSVREPIPDLVTSSATRPGVAGLFKYLANEVAGDGVLLNTIVPGRIDTDRFRGGIAHAAAGGNPNYAAQKVADIPVGRLGEAEEVANAVCFLVSARAAYINGVALAVDGGVIRAI